MLIRSATPSDVTAVLPMVDQICSLHETWDSSKYGFLPNPAKRYKNWLSELAVSDRSVFLVAERTSKDSPASGAMDSPALVGFLVGTVEREIPIYRLSEYGFIHDLWVEPDYRSAGIGRQLVTHALQEFTRLNIQQVRLDTAKANEAARRLFQSCGFRVSTIELLADLTPSAVPPPDVVAN